jgi:hypothetical protein
MKPVFKEYNQGQLTLFPASLDSKIPEDSPVRNLFLTTKGTFPFVRWGSGWKTHENPAADLCRM